MTQGYCALVLHAHLPFVRHPEYETFLEERWLFEAITETYLPLVRVLMRIAEEHVPCRLTVSLSPPLLAMLQDRLLQDRYLAHLDRLIELCAREQERTRDDGHLHALAVMYAGMFQDARRLFADVWGRDLVRAFKMLYEAGVVELATTTATHALLPLAVHQPCMVALQIKAGIACFEKVFGFQPQGIWLPECGYYPGLERLLRDAGIRYFITEAHGLLHANPTPVCGVHAPLFTPAGVAAFARDQACTREVWSAREGFPGDPDYREFYRDIGHDLDFQYIKPYIADDVRVDTGIKYYRITGPTPHKELYYPEAALHKAAQHAEVFLQRRVSHIQFLARDAAVAPLIVAPFDAELFGHWWFEGPQWLDFFIRKAAYDQNTLLLTTLSDYLDRHPVHQTGMPATSSWGAQGYFEVWLNEKNQWIYPCLEGCIERMKKLLARYAARKLSKLEHRALNQALRELLLAQSSDWPFIIHTGTATGYAERRVKDHVARFHALADGLEHHRLDRDKLQALEYLDAFFPDVDFYALMRSCHTS